MPVCEHLVQFYDAERELTDSVVPFLAEGLSADEKVIVVATAEHRRAFEAELEGLGIDLEDARAGQMYVAIDAAQALGCLRPEGDLLRDAFDEVIGGLVSQSAPEQRPVRAYGEIVALLWDEGDSASALELERMWNQLLHREPLTLFCAYPAPSSPGQLQAIRQICRSHSAVVPSITIEDPQPAAGALVTEFSPDLEAPRHARAVLRATLRERHFSEDLIERSVLAVSELTANAVLHARTPFRLLVQPLTSSLWIGVEDQAPLSDRNQVIGRSPHGLGLIAALALRWGVTPRNTGKLLWAELPL